MKKKKLNYVQISIQEYLDSRKVEIIEEKEKVSNGWVYSEFKIK